MKSTFQTVITAVGLAGLAVGFVTLSELLDRLATIEARLAGIEQGQLERVDAVVPAQVSATAPAKRSTIDRSAQKSSDGSVESVGLVESSVVQMATRLNGASNESPASSLATAFVERGYLYDQDWESVSPALTTMSPEDNKAFWIKMNEALADGTVEVYSE